MQFETLFSTPRLRVFRDERGCLGVENTNVKRPAAVLPVCADGRYILVEEMRFAGGSVQPTLNIPRGGDAPNETSQQCAQRELAEEIGVALPLERLIFLGTLAPDNGILTTEVDVFVAILGNAPIPVEAFQTDEVLRLHALTEAQIQDQAAAGKITDAFTFAALALWNSRYRKLGVMANGMRNFSMSLRSSRLSKETQAALQSHRQELDILGIRYSYQADADTHQLYAQWCPFEAQGQAIEKLLNKVGLRSLD